MVLQARSQGEGGGGGVGLKQAQFPLNKKRVFFDDMP